MQQSNRNILLDGYGSFGFFRLTYCDGPHGMCECVCVCIGKTKIISQKANIYYIDKEINLKQTSFSLSFGWHNGDELI